MLTAKSNNKKVIDFACNFSEIVKKENWVSRYDVETDAFYFSVKKLPNDARLQYFGDEIAFYITKDNKIKGIFIEYFKSNFIKHCQDAKDIKNLLKDIEKEKKLDQSLIECKNIKRMNDIISELEEAIQESVVEKK